MDLQKVCQFLSDAQASGARTVLVTVCAVEGSSMRNPGAIMGVCEDGRFEGSLSGGCIENAVVAEALEALNEGRSRVVRFGAGSAYLDIRLPCGGGLDLHFAPLEGADLPALCLDAVNQRAPFSLTVSPEGAEFEKGWQQTAFDAATGTGQFGHWPRPRLQIIGHGAGVEELNRLALASGCATRVLTPDERISARLDRQGCDVHLLRRANETGLLASDPWTAIIFLFHDHDWETQLMAHAFDRPHFYIGAMGGLRAHEQRLANLRALGATDEKLMSLKAPIGMFHSSRDPQTLALSTLAQVIQTYQQTDFEAALG